MIIEGYTVGAFRSNCFVLAARAGDGAVVVDPGQDAVEPLNEQLAKHRLTPAAVLLTHGHFDHVLSAAQICAEHDVPAQLALEAGMACGFGACFGCVVPTRDGYLRLCVDGPVLDAAGLEAIA